MITQTDSKATAHDWRARLALIYGALCYLSFLSAALYAVGFFGDLVVPKGIDTGGQVPLPLTVIVDGLLLTLFAVQHSIMARPIFKQWWTQYIPPSIERSTYVLFASLTLLFLYWQWRPLPTTIWIIANPFGRGLAIGLYGLGWGIVILSTFLIDHGDLFGLRQVYDRWQAQQRPTMGFKTPSLYRLVRHPMMAGFLVVFWATPHMTWGHLLFALAATGYILVGIHFEERDLLASFGAVYQRYRQRVPMLFPLPKHPQSTQKSD